MEVNKLLGIKHIIIKNNSKSIGNSEEELMTSK